MKRLTCCDRGNVYGLNRLYVLKSIFLIPLLDNDLFLGSHSERTIPLQYMFQITVIIIAIVNVTRKNVRTEHYRTLCLFRNCFFQAYCRLCDGRKLNLCVLPFLTRCQWKTFGTHQLPEPRNPFSEIHYYVIGMSSNNVKMSLNKFPMQWRNRNITCETILCFSKSVYYTFCIQ